MTEQLGAYRDIIAMIKGSEMHNCEWSKIATPIDMMVGLRYNSLDCNCYLPNSLTLKAF